MKNKGRKKIRKGRWKIVPHKPRKETVSISVGEQCKTLETPEKCPLNLAIWRVGSWESNCYRFRSEWEVTG